MRKFFERAIYNITTHGDTDIFPLPIENHILFDKAKDVVELLLEIDQHFPIDWPNFHRQIIVLWCP
jgi:hypothetical protein